MRHFVLFIALGSLIACGQDTVSAPETEAAKPLWGDAFDSAGFEAATTGFRGDGSSYTALTAFSGHGPSYDRILVEVVNNDDRAGPKGPGAYALEDENYETCGLCVRYFQNCGPGGGCERQFLATSGDVILTTLLHNTMSVLLNQVAFEEIILDTDTFKSTKVYEGLSHGVERLSFGGKAGESNTFWTPSCVAPNAPPASDTCQEEGDYRLQGNIGNMTLTNCLGETFELHSGCGAHKVVWIVETTGWCPACKVRIPQMIARARQEPEGDVKMMIVMSQDNYGNPMPSLAECKALADEYGTGYEDVYIDNDYGAESGLFAYVPSCYDGMYFPWTALLDGRNMAYVYSDPLAGIGGIDRALNDVLATYE